ncbi:Hint domain-containing protein [Roseovarius sp. M141]|uniref:Hint domain-containing protein n=1 Tax=Roseovarius sp. M141 TaxID=2583806 RepID=UPI0020CCEBD9
MLGIIDQNDDGFISRDVGDTVNGSVVDFSYPGDTVTINVSGVGDITYTGATFYLANGQRVFTPTDGQILQSGTFVSSTAAPDEDPVDVSLLAPPCFTAGTLIETPSGLRKVELLEVGDEVATKDNGSQRIIWIGTRTVGGSGNFAPIHISEGALGNRRDLVVSPQHRMLVSGWQAELLFGEAEVLVAAKHLINGDTIYRAPCAQVTYLHLMLDEHQIIFAEGAATESLDPTSPFLAEDPEFSRELAALFPELSLAPPVPAQCARMVLKGYEGGMLTSKTRQ